MRKVLIVDDELLVQIGLKSMINWERQGFTVVGEARNGHEAIELFEKTDPDIVFVDIAMPVMNGLELIKILKEKKPAVKAVILTSHADFKFLKEAVDLGVCDYMLKSELSHDGLVKCLKKIMDELSCEKPGDNQDIAQTSQDSDILLEDDLFKIITGLYGTREEVETIIEKYKFNSVNSIWFISVALIIIRGTNLERYEKNPNHFKKFILSLAKQVFTENDFTVYFTIIDNKIVFLFNIDLNMNVPAVKEKILKLLSILKDNLKQFLNIDLTVGISKPSGVFMQLPELYKQAYRANEQSFFEDNEIVIFDENNFREEKISPIINFSTIESLMLVGDADKLKNYIDDIFNQIYKSKNKEYLRTAFIDLLSRAKVFAEQLYNNQNIINMEDIGIDYDAFEHLHTFNAVKDYIIDIYNRVMQMQKSQGKVQYSCIIQKSIEYIRNNYMNNISLTDVANYADVSKNYLSSLFKQEIGMNFSVYLLNYRIEKAKELLMKGNMKLYEIADLIGFENPYYFSKVFREIVGVSCREYQKMNYSNLDTNK
ncbi:MAG: response regulator [Acetivibrionales bacterium]|jgi:two-component system response regulator YesN